MQSAIDLRTLGVLAGLLLCAAPLPAQQPSTPPAPALDPLAATLTVTASGKTLLELLQKLNADGRPRLLPDVAVESEHVSVFVNQKPLSKVMRGLHILLNYDWLPEPEKPPILRYTLDLTEAQRRYEHELWQQTLERGAAALFELTRYLDKPEEEYQRLYDLQLHHGKEPEDPILRDNLFYLGRGGPRLGLRLLTTLTPEQRTALLENGRYVLTQAEMTGVQAQYTHGLGQSVGEFRKKAERALPAETPEDSAALADQWGIILAVSVHPVTGAIVRYGYGLGEGSMVAAILRRMPPPPDLLPVRGSPYHVNLARKTPLPGYPTLERMPFPTDFKPTSTAVIAWRDVVSELARRVPIPIFSDEYAFSPDPRDRQYYMPEPNDPMDKMPRASRPPLGGLTLAAGLDALCNQYRYLWWYEDGMLFFRSRSWFIERQYEVPPSVLALVQEHLQRNGGKYDVACLTALSTLTPRQLQGITVAAGAYGATPMREMEIGTSSVTYGYLQIFSSLDAAQQEKVLSETGLPISEMTPPQQRAFVQMLFMTRGPDVLNRIPAMRFKAEHNGSDVSINPRTFRVPLLYFTYKEHDAQVAEVLVAYPPVKQGQDAQ